MQNSTGTGSIGSLNSTANSNNQPVSIVTITADHSVCKCYNDYIHESCSKDLKAFGYNTVFLIVLVIILYLAYLVLIIGVVNITWRVKQKRELQHKYPKNKKKQKQMRMLVKFVDVTNNESEMSTTCSVSSGGPGIKIEEIGTSLRKQKDSQRQKSSNQEKVTPQGLTPQGSTPETKSQFMDPMIQHSVHL